MKPRLKDKFEDYHKDYDDFYRFSSYYSQINWIRRLKKKHILEIGIGNKTVSTYLKNNGYKVVTFDFDERLKPDYFGDLRKMSFKDNQFQVIICCQVLEHLPFKDFLIGLRELHRVSKNYVVLSLPYCSLRLDIAIRFQNTLLHIPFRLPPFFLKMPNGGEHYWEIGRRGYSKNKVKRIIRKAGFQIIEEEIPTLNPYHHFFILRKK